MTRYEQTQFAEHLVGEDGRQFDQLIDENLPEELVDMVKQDFRSRMATKLDEADEKVEDARGRMAAAGAVCEGPVEACAARGGMLYTATVCASSEFYDDDGDMTFPAAFAKRHTKRDM